MFTIIFISMVRYVLMIPFRELRLILGSNTPSQPMYHGFWGQRIWKCGPWTYNTQSNDTHVISKISSEVKEEVNFIKVFMQSFYKCRSWKRKKLLELTVFLAPLESGGVKAVYVLCWWNWSKKKMISSPYNLWNCQWQIIIDIAKHYFLRMLQGLLLFSTKTIFVDVTIELRFVSWKRFMFCLKENFKIKTHYWKVISTLLKWTVYLT